MDPGVINGHLVEIRGLVEKPDPAAAPSNLAIVGRYILQPEVMTYLGRGETGAGNEIQLTDSMLELVGQSPFHGLILNGRRFDCGSKVGFLEAGIGFGLRRADIRDDLRISITELLSNSGD